MKTLFCILFSFSFLFAFITSCQRSNRCESSLATRNDELCQKTEGNLFVINVSNKSIYQLNSFGVK